MSEFEVSPKKSSYKSSESSLEKLKQDFIPLQIKYNLPNFYELNKEFQIERVSDVETDFILREMRKYVSDKLQNYLRFVEAILNPTEASMFVFMIVKSVNSDEKKKFTEIYKKLAKINFDFVELDVEYSEEKEAEFLIRSYKLWNEIKKDLSESCNSISKNWGNGIEFSKTDYLG